MYKSIICKQCGKKSVCTGPTQRYCKECAKGEQKRWRRERKELGFCSLCGKRKPKLGCVTCSICLEKNAKRKAEWKKDGRCIFCGKKTENGYQSCLRCSYYRRTRRFNYEDRKRALLDLNKKHKRCKICGSFKSYASGWALDHCHKTNRYRGLLCMNCNIALGLLKDRIKFLKRAIVYLKGATH